MDANELNLRSFQRHLRAANKAGDTIESYSAAVTQLAAHHQGADVLALDKAAVETFLAHLLQCRAPATAQARFRGLKAFYQWAVNEELIDHSPVTGMTAPFVPEKPVPVISDEQLRALLDSCSGKDFEARRDTAMIRLFCEPGGPRRAEMAGVSLDDLDLQLDVVRVIGKGGRERAIPFGPKTGQAIERYLRARAGHRGAHLPALWLSYHGRRLTKEGINQMIRRRAERAGIGHIHPHQLRHTAAHVWLHNGGGEVDAMRLFGWRSRTMLVRYGASVADERALEAARRMNLGDRL